MNDLNKLIAHFNSHVAGCFACRDKSTGCLLGQAMLAGIGRLVVQQAATERTLAALERREYVVTTQTGRLFVVGAASEKEALKLADEMEKEMPAILTTTKEL